jgi:small GTP-binding protein
LLAQWQLENRSGLALLPRYYRVDWYVENGWELEEIFTLDDSVSWDDLAPLVECSGLRRLALPDANLGEAGARAIAENLTNLQSLELSSNNVGEAGARAIAEKLTNLHRLTLSSNNVGDAGARAIAENLTNLQTLDLNNNNVGEAGARVIAENLTNLHTLNLFGNNVGGAGARAIAEKLTNLHTLDLGSNNVGDAGARAIGENLTNLQSLYLRTNNVGEAGARAIAEKLTNLRTLNLDNNNNVGEAGAKAIAEKLTNLQWLDLGSNNVGEAGARAIAEKLTNLQSLCLDKNNVGDVSARAIAERLTKLQRLDLRTNNIGEVGARAIAENLTDLQSLDLSFNRLTDDSVRRLAEGLPSLRTIHLHGNESLRLPKELLRSTDAAGLRDYFRRSKSEGKRKLNEAKLIVVGNEAVGKTALVNYLIKDEPCRDTDKTPGLHIQERIEVTCWDTHHTTPNTEKLRLNVWDFGGQEVTRETHKLFLTARSLYLVVLEARRENVADAENVLHDWMRAIRNRGGDDVPVIVVINKSERDRELRLDETTLKKTYPIIDFIRTSCRDPKQDQKDGGKGIVALRQTIIDTIRLKIPQASDEFPLSYFEVKERLREIAKAEHSFDVVRFTNICRDVAQPVTSEDEQRRLLQLLGDIGVVILHKERTLLDPNWLTTAIYRVLTHSDVVKEGGRFRVDDLGRLLMGLEDASRRYPKERWQYIVDQTVQCGLSFEIADQPGTYLMPEQLSPNAIDTGLDRVEDPQVLRFRYHYEDIPKGLIPRFIVKMHLYLSKSPTYWANGVVLVVGACKILVRSDRRVRWVEIFVHGPANERREALRIVREGLEWVHSLFEEIGPKPMVPVRIPNKPDAAIEYSQLIEFERAGLEEFPFEGVRCKVRELLTGIAPVAPIQKSEDRKSDLHIYASDKTIVQFINGNDNVTSGGDNRTAQGISLPIAAQPKPFWQPLIAPIAVSVATAVLLLMWMQGFEPKWIALFGLPLLAGGVVYLGNLQREIVARTWARRFAAWCLAIAGASLMAPGVEFLVELQPDSKIKFVLDNAPWPGIAFLVAGCIFGWLQYKIDARQEASGMSSS